jgi:CRP-like cAMP-binding protein
MPMADFPLTHDERAERRKMIAVSARDGKSIRKIIRENPGVSISLIKQACKEFGISIPKRNQKRNTTSTNSSVLSVSAALFDKSMSFRDIAEKHGISRQRVQQIYAQGKGLGIPFPHRIPSPSKEDL